MRLVYVAALLLLTLALCRAEEEVTEETEETTVETTTMSLRNRLRPRLRLQTTGAPTVQSSDGELMTQEGDSSAASVTPSVPSTTLPQTSKPNSKRPRNRNRNRKSTTPASISAASKDSDDDDVKSTASTTRRPKSRSRNRNRNRSSSTTKAPTDRSTTTRSSKRRGSGRKTSTTTPTVDNLDVTTPKPSRGRKTIPPRRTRPTPRRQTSSTTPSSTTTVASQSKTTKRSRLRSGSNPRTPKNLVPTTTPTIPTTVTTEIPRTTTRATVITTPQFQAPGISFVPLPDKQGDFHSVPKTHEPNEHQKIHPKPAFASDSVFLNGGFEEEPVRGGDVGWQGVPPKVVGPVSFTAGRRHFRPLPEEGVILDAQEKPVDPRMPPTKEPTGMSQKLAGVPLTVIDPVIGGAGRDTRPSASHPQSDSLEGIKRPSSAGRTLASGAPPPEGTSALLLLPPNEKPFPPGARRELFPLSLKPDGFNEENMEVVPEKEPSRFEEPIGVPPKPVGPLPLRPLPKKIASDTESDNLNSRFAPGERVFIPPPEDRPELTTRRSVSVPAKAQSVTPQRDSVSRDPLDSRFTLRTEAPIRPNLVSSSPALNDRRNSHRLNIAEVPLDNKVAHRVSATTPLPLKRYSESNSIRQKTRVTEPPTTANHEKEDASGVRVKPRPNNVTPFPLWIDPRLTKDTEFTTSSPRESRTTSRPVASKRVTIPFPFEEDELQTGTKSRVPSRQQQRVTFAPNPLRRTTTLGTTTTTPQTISSSVRPRLLPHSTRQQVTITTTPQTPPTTLDEAEGEDFSEEEEELEERLTFPPRRNTEAPVTSPTVSRSRVTLSPLESNQNAAQRDQSQNRFASSQNSFASQQFLESTPRRPNFQTARAVGTSMPFEQDTAVSASIPKASSTLAQSSQPSQWNTNSDMSKDMRMDKDMVMKAKPMVTTPQSEFISTEDVEEYDDEPLELENLKPQVPASKVMPAEAGRVLPSTLPSATLKERLPERPVPLEITTENARNMQTNMESGDRMAEIDSRSSFASREPFSVPAQSRFVSLENQPSSMPARGRNSLPIESSSTLALNGFPQATEKARSPSPPASSLPPRQLNAESFDRGSAARTTPLINENARQRPTVPPPPLDNFDSRRPAPEPQMKKEMRPSRLQLEEADPLNGSEFPDDVSPPQPSGRLLTPSLLSNPQRPAGPSEFSKSSQFLESPSFVIRKPVSQAPPRDQVQVVPEVPEGVPTARKPSMGNTEALEVMTHMKDQPMMKPELQASMPNTRDPSIVKSDMQEPMTKARDSSMVNSDMQGPMTKARDSPMVKSEAQDSMPMVSAQPMTKDGMVNMKDVPKVDADEVPQVQPGQRQAAVLEEFVTPADNQNTKMVPTQSTTLAGTNPEEGVDYEYYYA